VFFGLIVILFTRVVGVVWALSYLWSFLNARVYVCKTSKIFLSDEFNL